MSKYLGKKNNNRVVRVTPEKKIGRVHVGRYFLFFYIFFQDCLMT